jgi:hypothetical protein
MTFLRRYLGVSHRALLWTILLGGGGALAIQRVDVRRAVTRLDPELATYVTRPAQVGVVAAVWLLGIVLLRRRERQAWAGLLANTPFEAQRDDRRFPPLQLERKRKTISVERIDRGLVRQRGVRVEAIVDGVSEPLDVSLRYVGSGGQEAGIRTGNETLDDQFVLTVEAGSDLREVFDPEVQSALMDIAVPGTLRITDERISYEIPFTRLRPDELGAVTQAVATIAARLERLARKGRR